MLEWQFDDGTTVRNDGSVDGDSEFAVYLRQQAAMAEAGITVPVGLYVEPGGSVPLDFAKPYTIDPWLRKCARLKDVSITVEPDELPEVPNDPRGEFEFRANVTY